MVQGEGRESHNTARGVAECCIVALSILSMEKRKVSHQRGTSVYAQVAQDIGELQRKAEEAAHEWVGMSRRGSTEISTFERIRKMKSIHLHFGKRNSIPFSSDVNPE